MKQTKRQMLSVTIAGKTYKGSRTIVGTRKLTQIIRYHGKSHINHTKYSPRRKELMKWVALYYLGAMVLNEEYSDQNRTKKRK